MVNAAIWLGAGIFYAAFVLPGVFSSDTRQLFTDETTFKYLRAGAVAMILFKCFFALQYICGVIALLHLFAEKL